MKHSWYNSRLVFLVFASIAIVALVNSCGSHDQKEHDDFEFVIKPDSNIFKGVYIGMILKDLLKTSEIKPELVDSSSVLFLIVKDSAELAFSCELDNGKVTELEADVALPSAQRASDLVVQLTQYFDQKIGDHVAGKGTLYWNAEDRGQVYNIEISDVSPVQGGRVMITIHP